MPARMFFIRAVILRKLARKCNGICTTIPRARKRRCYENPILVVQLLVSKLGVARMVLADSHSRKIILV